MEKTTKLSNGIECPTMGLGAMLAKGEDLTYQAIKDGTRLIDTASAYKNEDLVGKGIKKAIDEGIVKREDLFIITKLNIDEEKNDPETALNNSLKRLQLTYVDLYLDHWPLVNMTKDGVKTIPLKETWKKMEKLVESGKTKMIGCSNYNVQSLLTILSFCKIRPCFNEVEFHPFFSIKIVETNEPFHRNMIKYDSFIIIMNIGEPFTIRVRATGDEVQVPPESSCLIPAAIADYELIPAHGTAKVMEAFINNKKSIGKTVKDFFHLFV